MKICGIEFKEYRCLDCGTVTINNQTSGPRCRRCFEKYQDYDYGEQVAVKSGKKAFFN